MRLIDADALDKMLMDAQAISKEKGGNFRCGVIGNVRENIRMMPTIEQRKKGHWKKPKFADDKRWHQCSECGVTTEKLDKHGFKLICNYCPVCGADMREEGDGE